MSDTAILKIDRAEKHIGKLNKTIQNGVPFSYILEINTKTGECSTFAKKNESVMAEIALVCGDVIQNLRSSLDHAYWEIVSRALSAKDDLKAVQFPFSETFANLDQGVRRRKADRVSPAFFEAIINLKPHGEAGGNELLYMIHKLGILDRHRLLIPLADYREISFDALRSQISCFPPGLTGTVNISQLNRDIVWHIHPWSRAARRRSKVPDTGIIEQKLNVPIDIIFSISELGQKRTVVSTLCRLVEIAKETIFVMRNA